MSWQPDPDSIEGRLAGRLGPETVALALTVLVLVAAWLLLRTGPTAGRGPGPSPSPAPSSGALTIERAPSLLASPWVSGLPGPDAA